MQNAASNSSAEATGKGRFGTLAGVFTPTTLTILGLILFLRTGYVVGQSGLLGAFLIIMLANMISFLTGLSLSAVGTNMHVKTGGAYYMISRTLGLEIGGAIGIPLYLSQAISVAFYIIGFTEAFTAVYSGLEPRFISIALALAFGLLAFVGADFVLRIQFVVLAILAMAILSFFAGGWGASTSPAYFAAQPWSTSAFWGPFAIFFPAVTGVAVGVSMSGDLKNPAKSIPLGTLGAIGVTCLVYLGSAFWMATHASTAELTTNNMIMHKIARWPVFVLLGVLAATLSSALGTVLAAPRTLQALSFDNVLPRFAASQLGSATEPRFAVLITTLITIAVILMGDLNFVAPVITMFFLNTYGMINLAAGIEGLVGNPSFRPQFKTHWGFSLLGAAACYAVMFLVNAKATIVAVLISYGVFFLLENRSLRRDWSDVRSGLWFSLARFGLIRLESLPWSVKNWRPNIVVFTGQPDNREELMEMGTWLSSGRGIVTFYHFLVGDLDELTDRGLRQTSRNHVREYLQSRGAAAFAECSIVDDLYGSIATTLQVHGVAGFEPNTALLGWSSNREGQKAQLELMHRLVALKKSVLFLYHDENCNFGRKRQLDIWWRGKDRNAELMLLLAHVIKQSGAWEGAKIRILRLIDSDKGREGAEQHMAELLDSVRIEAEPTILVRSAPDEPFVEVLRRSSRETDLVFLGLRLSDKEGLRDYADEINELLQSTCSAILVRSGEVEDILDAE